MTGPIGQFVDSTTGRTSTNPFITIQENRAPTGNDGINNGLQVGQRWIDKADSNQEYFLLGFIASNGYIQANWVPLGGSNSVETLSGNSGGPVGVDSNSNINVVGDGTTIEVVGNPATHTLTITATDSGLVQTLSDDVGTVITPTAGNIQLVGHVNEQGDTKFSTVVAGSSVANINPMSSARWIVDPLGFNGTHTTISAAITSATSGDTIAIMDGIYSENLTLKDGVNLCASTANGIGNSNVIINGKCSYSGSTSVGISNIVLQTNSDYFLDSSATGNVTLTSCILICLNHTGINQTSSGNININSCGGSLSTTGIALYTVSGTGTIGISRTSVGNPGLSTTPSTISASAAYIFYSFLDIPLSAPGSGTMQLYSTNINCLPINTPCVETSGSGSVQIANCSLGSGSASVLSIGSGTQIDIDSSYVSSSNTNAFTGSGTINYGGIVFGTSSGINVTTQNPVLLSPFRSSLQPSFLVTITSSPANVTGDGTEYKIVFDHVNFDQTSSYNTSTGQFTAPISGNYQFNAACFINNTSTPMSSFDIVIVTTTATFRNKVGCATTATADTGTAVFISIIAQLTAGQTAEVHITAGVGTKTCGVSGSGGGNLYDTYFSGNLLC